MTDLGPRHWLPGESAAAFEEWVRMIEALSRERYDATPQEMYGEELEARGDNVMNFYRDWYFVLSRRGRADISATLAEIITDIEGVLETGVGTLERGENER